MPRLDRGIQYAAAPRFNHCRLWNTGSPGQAGRWQPCVGKRASPRPASSGTDIRPNRHYL